MWHWFKPTVLLFRKLWTFQTLLLPEANLSHSFCFMFTFYCKPTCRTSSSCSPTRYPDFLLSLVRIRASFTSFPITNTLMPKQSGTHWITTTLQSAVLFTPATLGHSDHDIAHLIAVARTLKMCLQYGHGETSVMFGLYWVLTMRNPVSQLSKRAREGRAYHGRGWGQL